ncbi:hypothetical protein TSH58p_03755 [Azospirillum sp. TSH58]|uniref:hypothetical protein n=1 Tax=Azospirillum sp. TSH58 TaxID=664962 RepID=UPI000D5FEEE7|nr:hypothetical protein [Azospirillum sp. TSH58]AWJ82709.1 hypothetical protein TSH58p_03755 [Azospirillum sp. TSH58]PWC58008.1 hypothetical protein TSH58_30820 [Azospirillum sp. TSH58]
MLEPLSRRSILAGASAVALAGPVSADAVDPFSAAIAYAETDGRKALGLPPAGEPHPDAELLRLCLDWLDSWAESDRLNLEARSLADRLGLRGGINHPDFCALDDLAEAEGRRGGELLDRLCPIAALTLDGLFAKAVIGMRDEWLTDPSASSRLSSNILSDLHRLVAPGAGQQVQRILNHPVTVAALAEVFGEGAPMAGTACGRAAA